MATRNSERKVRQARGALVGVAVFAAFALFVATLAAQPPAPQGGGRGGRGTTITSPCNAYPARPPGDPAAIERGKALYCVNCQFCHGADIARRRRRAEPAARGDRARRSDMAS